MSRFFDYYFWGRDEERRTKGEGRGKMEDGSRLGLPESEDGVGEFVLEDFDDFLFSL
ncbi:MAG: hypothetical protein NTX52_01985 [Planctomycetota bacterium]|nr:hypothetical protein [Planctomycetota bacterium]